MSRARQLPLDESSATGRDNTEGKVLTLALESKGFQGNELAGLT